MDKTHFILSHTPSNPPENFRAACCQAWTKRPSFAPQIDFREIVTKLVARRSWSPGFLIDAAPCRPLCPQFTRRGGRALRPSAFGCSPVPPLASRAPRVQRVSRFKRENPMCYGILKRQSRHSLFALDEKTFSQRMPAPCLPGSLVKNARCES